MRNPLAILRTAQINPSNGINIHDILVGRFLGRTKEDFHSLGTNLTGRMALGANRGDVVGMMLRSAFNQVGLGLCIGVPLAILCGHYLAHHLYGVGRFNPLVLAGATITLSVCTLVASFLPARRAASIEPVQALRSE